MQRGYALYVVAYDISLNSERRKTDKVLSDFGFRMQKSLFSVELNKAGLAQLCKRLRLLKLQTGHVMIWRVMANFERIDIGNAPPQKDDEIAFII